MRFRLAGGMRGSWQLGSDRLSGRLKDEKTARHGAELAVARERHSRQLAEERVAQLEAQLEGSRIRAADDKQNLAGELTAVHQVAVEAAVADAVAAATDEALQLAAELASAEECWASQLEEEKESRQLEVGLLAAQLTAQREAAQAAARSQEDGIFLTLQNIVEQKQHELDLLREELANEKCARQEDVEVLLEEMEADKTANQEELNSLEEKLASEKAERQRDADKFAAALLDKATNQDSLAEKLATEKALRHRDADNFAAALFVLSPGGE